MLMIWMEVSGEEGVAQYSCLTHVSDLILKNLSYENMEYMRIPILEQFCFFHLK